jgi:predicted O-methyltransferase YrrM
MRRDYSVLEERSLHSIGMQIDRTPFEAPLTGVRGWLSPEERRTLYGLALYTEGRVLEIGPWLGLSTACLAYGIRDRGVPRAFVTADLNPRPEFYHRLGDKVGFKLPGDDAYRNVSS